MPKLACLEWPLLKPPALGGLEGLAGDVGVCVGEMSILERVEGMAPDEIALSRLSATPLGLTGTVAGSIPSAGLAGSDAEIIAFPSSESTSKSSGGSRSFSMSDLRLV